MNNKYINNKLLALFIVTILGVLIGGLISPIEMIYLERITHNSTLSSFAFTIATISTMVGTIFFSQLANKYSRRSILILGMIVCFFMPLFYSAINNTFQAYGVKFSWAFASGGISIIIGAMFQKEVQLYKESAGRLFGILYSLQAIAGSIGTFIGGLLTEKYEYFSVFYLISFLILIQFLLIISLYQNKFENNADFKLNSDRNLIQGIKFIWANNEIKQRLILSFGNNISWSTKLIIYPLIILAVSKNNSVGEVGMILATQGLIAFMVLPIIGQLVDKFGYLKLLYFGHIVLAIGILAFSLSSQIWGIWISICIIAFGEASVGPAKSTLEVMNIPEKLRNSIIAAQNVFDMIVGSLSTIFVGILLKHIKPQILLSLIACIIALTIFESFRIRKSVLSIQR